LAFPASTRYVPGKAGWDAGIVVTDPDGRLSGVLHLDDAEHSLAVRQEPRA
jgi:hypothetical protein